MPKYGKASKARVPETSDYSKKGRLRSAGAQIDRYRAILDKDNFQPEEPHWRRISKNTVSLFQVLIDQDLQELVMVLEHYPRYIEWVCEHFRYAYSYSENEANIDAASRLLELGEPFFTKQFVRNLVRKLPRLDAMEPEALKTFAEQIAARQERWHPIITNHYCEAISETVESRKLHLLQRLAITGKISGIARIRTFEYDTEDRDAVLDIPYMN